MMTALSRLWRDDRAAGAAEFALVLPVMLIFLLGSIDVGRLMWEYNRAEKATQVGARFAAVTTPVSLGLVDADFASASLPAGDLIPADALGSLKCTSATCSCDSGDCSVVTDMSVDSVAFNAIVTRMQQIDPRIAAENVEVVYRGSGFGFAGDAAGAGGGGGGGSGGGGGGGGGGAVETMEISPLITVQLDGVSFTPISGLLLFSFNLPSFSATLPAEDASGQYSG